MRTLADLRSWPKLGRYRLNAPHDAGKVCPSLCHRRKRPTCFLVARIDCLPRAIERLASTKIQIVLHQKLHLPQRETSRSPERWECRGFVGGDVLSSRRLGGTVLGEDLAHWGYVKTRNPAGGSNKKPDPRARRVGLCQPPRKAASPPSRPGATH
jgi:hypothetical protein